MTGDLSVTLLQMKPLLVMSVSLVFFAPCDDGVAEITYSVSYDDPGGAFSSYYSDITSNLIGGGALWAAHLNGSAGLEVVVGFDAGIPTANGRSATSSYVRTTGDFDIFEQGAAAEVRTGIDPNGGDPDIEINIGTAYLQDELWFDPVPSSRTAPVPNDRTDAVSIFAHELGHAFAFNGWRDYFDGSLPGNHQSPYDELTIFDGTNFFFTGTQAVQEYGANVPLTYGNIAHVANEAPRPGDDLLGDMMNGVDYNRGWRYEVSLLDLAIFADVGVPVVPPNFSASDFDEDGDVDGDDFLAWQTGFGTLTGAAHADGDADSDGDVDGDDFLVWQSQFGGGAGRGSITIPEPLSSTMAGIALVLLGGARALRRNPTRSGPSPS